MFVTSTALTSKIWLIFEDEAGEWQAQSVADTGDAAKIPLPVDISLFADDSRLWVNTWNDGMTRLYDISDPHHARQIYSKKIGEQVNMVSQSWDGKRVSMGFIYTRCSDINGCPLASYVMRKVQDTLVRDAVLKSQVRLISLSFDPEMDTPQALRDYSRHFRRADFDWQFLTTRSEDSLQPILEAYGQWRQKNYENGQYSGSMSHILRVFLIDRQGRIRNIYATGFLHPQAVLNDLRTLNLESGPAATQSGV